MASLVGLFKAFSAELQPLLFLGIVVVLGGGVVEATILVDQGGGEAVGLFLVPLLFEGPEDIP